MGDETYEAFDLPALLRSGDLDIPGIASRNMSLPVGDYYGLLAKFLDNAPHTADALSWIITNGADKDVLQTLSASRALLESIGGKKLASSFDEIITGSRQGDKTFTAASAKRILDDFNLLCRRIQRAKVIQTETDDMPDQGHENYSSYGTHSLKKVLQILEHDEASRKLRILAVDDAPVMLKIISSVLGEDYKVYTLVNPQMLKKFLQQITPELFLLDYQMPGLSGFDCVPIIRGFEEHSATPIIFLTSLGTIDHISGAVALGACDFIVKPFQAEILREKVARHIVRKSLFK